MPDYSNQNTPLTANRYAWSATAVRGPAQRGSNASTDITGSYTAPPGATVGTLLDGIRGTFAKEWRVPTAEVVLVRYSLREK